MSDRIQGDRKLRLMVKDRKSIFKPLILTSLKYHPIVWMANLQKFSALINSETGV